MEEINLIYSQTDNSDCDFYQQDELKIQSNSISFINKNPNNTYNIFFKNNRENLL
jgi:hypothetical protein